MCDNDEELHSLKESDSSAYHWVSEQSNHIERAPSVTENVEETSPISESTIIPILKPGCEDDALFQNAQRAFAKFFDVPLRGE